VAASPPTEAVALSGQQQGAEATTAVQPRGLWTRSRVLLMLGAYIAALALMVAVKGVFISADRYFLILLAPAAALGLTRRYVRDFLPFVVLILLYEHLRGLAHLVNADLLGRDSYGEPMIAFDQLLAGGRIPTAVLQDWLWTGSLETKDHVLALVSRAHFIVPPTLLFLVWLERRELFYRCAAAFVVASFAGALAFLIFPATPPWLAAQQGLVEPLTRIGSVQADASVLGSQRSLIANAILPNPVAAVPSLHTAYSLLTLLTAWAWHRRLGYVFLLYPLTMWFTIVYFADHYVFDILVGVLFGAAAWWWTGRELKPGGRLERLAGPFEPPLQRARG
jgi:hypothetical protein